jgi:hypothetical protein
MFGMLEVVEVDGEGAVTRSGVAQATLGGMESRGAKGLPTSMGCVRLGSMSAAYADEFALQAALLMVAVAVVDEVDVDVDVDCPAGNRGPDCRKGEGESRDL